MKQLAPEFVANFDKSGKNRFVQLKLNDSAAIYRREHLDGTVIGYETFAIKVGKAGSKLPDGNVVAEDYVKYPTAKVFGKWAWFCQNETRANEWFDKFNNEPIDLSTEEDETEIDGDVDTHTTANEVVTDVETGVKRRGRVAKVRAEVTYPTTEKWSVKDILALNPDYEQPTMSLFLKDQIDANKVKLVGQAEKAEGQRGKAANLYSLV